MNHPLNRWQAARQAEFLLKSAVWVDAPGEAVLMYAATSDLPVEHVAHYESMPFALLRPGSGESDLEHPELGIVLRMEVEVAAVGQVDLEGSSTLVGGGRVAPSGGLTHQGHSEGRGLYEIEELLRQVLNSEDGSGAMLSACTISSSGVPVPLGEGEFLSSSKLQLEIFNSGRDRFYPPPRVLTIADVGGHQTRLTWTLPPRRWDTLGGATPQLAIYYVTGTSVSPTWAQVGATLFTPTAGATTATITTGAGQKAFTVFAIYDETGNGVNERQSPAIPIAQSWLNIA